MRMLGPQASLSSFRWDIIYLLAQLTSDTRPGVAELAPQAQTLLDRLKAEREALETAEDAWIIATAIVNKKDKRRDELVIQVGGVARVTDKAVYDILYGKKNPSKTAKLGIAAESVEVARILGEIAKLPETHPVRAAYFQELTEAEAGVKAADGHTDGAATTLALQRSQIDRFKLECDQGRLSLHGQLVTLLKSKEEADSFFRPSRAAPGKPKAAGGDTDAPDSPDEPDPPDSTP